MLLLIALPIAASTQPKRIAPFVPHAGKFWGEFAEFAKAAAMDVGANLELHVAGRSPQQMFEQVGMATAVGVDGNLFTDYQGFGESILQIAEANRTPAILVNAALLNREMVPRGRYRYWIGSGSVVYRPTIARRAHVWRRTLSKRHVPKKRRGSKISPTRVARNYRCYGDYRGLRNRARQGSRTQHCLEFLRQLSGTLG